MQRGVITLNVEEVNEIFTYFDVSKYEGYPLEAKLTSAKGSTNPDIMIELSQEELELILDSVIIPDSEDSESKKSLRKKIHDLLTSFHQNGK